MTLVADTGPLIALAKVDALRLPTELFGTVLIPPAVREELLGKVGPEAPRLRHAIQHTLEVRQPSDAPPEVQAVVSRYAPGERDALLLAHQLEAPLLIDERFGREAARSLKLDVIGVAGLLIRAKRTGLIGAAVPILLEMRRYGYWLSDGLIETTRALSNEPE